MSSLAPLEYQIRSRRHKRIECMIKNNTPLSKNPADRPAQGPAESPVMIATRVEIPPIPTSIVAKRWFDLSSSSL